MALQGSSIGTDDIFDQADKAIAIQYLMTEMEYHLIVFYGFERNIHYPVSHELVIVVA